MRVNIAILAVSSFVSTVSADFHYKRLNHPRHGPSPVEKVMARRDALAAEYAKVGLVERERMPVTASASTSTVTASPSAVTSSAASSGGSSPTSTSSSSTSTSISPSSASSASSAPSSIITSAPSSSSASNSTASSSVSLLSIPSDAGALRCPTVAVGGTTVAGTGTLPKPTAFVTKSSTSQGLTLSGAAFRIVGPNIYWLCNDENVAPVGAPTDKGRVREALAMAVAMGANTVRLLSCGVSVGFQYALEPTLGNFGNWDIHDYVIYAAGQYGLRVILPLTDNYSYYHGGKYTFLNWRGLNTGNYGALFYTNSQVISDYQQYITTLLTHVNTYSGLSWANDPTIVAWETGNELGGYIGNDGYPPAAWTLSIVNTIRAVDNNHLIIDGTDGFYNYSTKATAPGLSTRIGTQIMSDHGYPRNNALINSEIPLATTPKKGFLIGEYDWTNSFGGDTLTSFLANIESTSYMGDMFWNLQGHDAQCCNYVQHNDGYSMYYPGTDSSTNANILAIVQHWYRITGRTVPRVLNTALCPQPVF